MSFIKLPPSFCAFCAFLWLMHSLPHFCRLLFLTAFLAAGLFTLLTGFLAAFTFTAFFTVLFAACFANPFFFVFFAGRAAFFLTGFAIFLAGLASFFTADLAGLAMTTASALLTWGASAPSSR